MACDKREDAVVMERAAVYLESYSQYEEADAAVKLAELLGEYPTWFEPSTSTPPDGKT